jgi:hypothetical protein
MNFTRLITDIGVATVAQLRANVEATTSDYLRLAAGMLPKPPPAAMAKFEQRLSEAGNDFARACMKGVDVSAEQRAAFAAALTAALLLPAARTALATLERELAGRVAGPVERAGGYVLTEMPRGQDE